MTKSFSSNEGYVDPNSFSIVFVLLSEKGDERHFFSPDSSTEEAPENNREDNSGEWVSEADLSAESPGEEAEIGGMARVAEIVELVSGAALSRGMALDHNSRIDAIRDQLMVMTLVMRYLV